MEKGYPKEYKQSELISDRSLIAVLQFFSYFSHENSVEHKVHLSHFSFTWATGLHPKLKKKK